MSKMSTKVLTSADFPERFDSVEELEDFMTTPTQALVDDMRRLDGDILVLGVGGKMGPTLAPRTSGWSASPVSASPVCRTS